jgi:HAD superfamily hydrolase (TIGR01509 family)
MATLSAIIFDVDGTLAETEEWHREAFNDVFDAFAIPWHWEPELYRELLQVTGGKERMLHCARFHDPRRLEAIEAQVWTLHRAKNERYADLVLERRGALRPGVRRLISEARLRGVRLAIATTTSRANVLALLTAALGRDGAGMFDAMVCGEDVKRKKPDPEVYRLTLSRLGVAAEACVAIEDSRNGLLAARAAGLRTIVTPSVYSAGEDVSGAALVATDLDHAIGGRPLTLDAIEALLA